MALLLAVLVAGCLGPPGRPHDAAPGPEASAPKGPAAYLAAEPFQEVWVELDLANGTTAPARLDDALQVLSVLVGKPVEVRLQGRLPDAAADPTAWHSLTQLEELAAASSDLRLLPAGGGAPLHIVVVRGNHTNPLGVTSALTPVGGHTVFVFPDGLAARWREGHANATANGWTPADLELAVLVHELGHLLGLVGCGTDAVPGREDPGSECHSADPASVMQAKVAQAGRWPARDGAACFGPFRFTAADLEAVGAPDPCPSVP